MDRELLKKQLITDEGLKLFPYRCTANKISIGVGRNLEDNPLTLTELIFIGIRERTPSGVIAELTQKGLTHGDAMYLLENDVDKVVSQLKKALPWFDSKPDAVQRVLSNLCFNIGITRLLEFKRTLALIKADKYEDAAREMLNSKWANQVGARSVRLSNLLKSQQNA